MKVTVIRTVVERVTFYRAIDANTTLNSLIEEAELHPDWERRAEKPRVYVDVDERATAKAEHLLVPFREVHNKHVIDLAKPEGNAMWLMGTAFRWAQQLGWEKKQIDELAAEMRAGDYHHLLFIFETHFGMFAELINKPENYEYDEDG